MDIDKLFEKVPYEKLYPVPAWQRYAVLFGLSIIVVALFYFVVITGETETIATLDQKLAGIQKEVQDNRSHASKLAKLKEKIAKLEADRQEAAKQLPSEKEIPELLEQVSTLGTQTGLEFVTFKPQAEIVREYYAEVPVSVEVTGRFHDILAFFDEIAHLPRIVTIGDIKITKLQAAGETGGRGAPGGAPKSGKPEAKSPSGVQLTCVATTYRFIEGSVGKDAKDANAAKDKATDKTTEKVAKKEANAK
ncbi:MAG: type 4a pilus biogenesis protein PilO [Nitrospinae bacterium]|nr:type 4a pilus biogenesis protein PilO [Nitrospinota bacterium]MBF0633631.1 type 4a pilus biogenesis protein PilO [Nitrospinota bacterium]